MTTTNLAPQFQADIENYIADETLPLTQKQLVVYQFGDPLELPEGRGLSYTATRFQRVPLPYAPLSEGVAPVGETMTIQQVTAVAQQWGDLIQITDIGELTIKHPLFKKAIELIGLQIAETLERNTMNALMASTQVNYVNSRGSRGALQAGDVLDPTTVLRTVAALQDIGAPQFMGQMETDKKIDAEGGGARASNSPRGMPHYVAVSRVFPVADLSQNPAIVTAWSYSDINRLYNFEFGEWRGMRFCTSNMVPSWTGYAALTYTGHATGGSLANTNYYVVVTGSDTQNQFESYITAVSTATATGGSAGSITFTTPNVTGYTFNAYIGLTANPSNLALSAAGPSVGPLAGQAVQLPPNTAITLTGVGVAQVPPAFPGNVNSLTVYPVFVFGKGAYGQIKLKDVEYSYLTNADKSDPINQKRIVGWKTLYGTILQNVQFMARIECVSAFSQTFT